MENTVHLLVWDESDQSGLDELEDTFQLIRVSVSDIYWLYLEATIGTYPG